LIFFTYFIPCFRCFVPGAIILRKMAGSESDAPPPYSASQPSEDENTPLLPPRYQATTPPPSARHSLKSQTQNLSRNRNTSRNKTCRLILLSLLATSIILALTHLYLTFFPFHNPSPFLPPPLEPPVRIAIVGAGPAGVAAAFQLSEEFKVKTDGRKVEVVVFERTQMIGGRMAVDVDLGGAWFSQSRVRSGDLATGDLFAAGGVVRGRAERFLGMEFGKKGNAVVKKEEVGFFDGKEIVSKVTRPVSEMSWGQWAALVWRYGVRIIWARNLPTRTTEGFRKLLNAEETFEGVREMVDAAGIGEAVSMSARERLKTNGVVELYREEVVEQLVRRQLGQGTEEISDLALSIALQREDQVVSNGGRLEDVLAEFLERSKAEVRMVTEVTDVRPEYVNGHKNGWLLELQKAGQRGKTLDVFDKVILAGSWNTTLEDYYRHVWIAFIASNGKLDTEYFGIEENTLLSQILIIDTPAIPSELRGVHEISHVRDLYGPDLSVQAVHKLYRVMSNNPISEELISKIGGGGILRVLHVKNQHAYPLLYPRSEGLDNFKIQDGLYRTDVVEEVASSADLSKFFPGTSLFKYQWGCHPCDYLGARNTLSIRESL
jgi:prenylcysteine oxidase/farnesylcysteine lyase